MSAIDTLAAGFRLVWRRPWLLILPIALDLFLLLGPKLSALPVISQAFDTMVAAQSMASGGEQMLTAEALATASDMVNNVIGRVNVFALAACTRLGFPSVAGTKPIDMAIDRVYTIESTGTLLLCQFGLLLVGLLLTAAFLVSIAQAIREEHDDLATTMHHILSSWLKFLSLLVPLGLGLVIGLSILAVMPGGVGLLLMMALMVAAVWALIYLAFVPEAITLSHDSALGALNSSFRLVRSNLGPTIGILILVTVLRNGMGLVWQNLLLRSQLAALLAIVGSAYVGTSLTAALFFYYRDRLTRSAQREGVRSIRL